MSSSPDWTSSPDWLLRGPVRRTRVMVPTRDGTRLAADAYVPTDREAPGPTIVERTPYDRRNGEMLALASAFVARGYNVVIQDTRGRGDSEGVFQHYIAMPHEGEDGYDLLDWITAQDWSDGTVGTTGLSFTGSNQQSLAITGHPALKSQVILDAAINYFRRTVREDGAFVAGQLGTFALRMALTSPEARRDPRLRAELEKVRDRAKDWFGRAPWREGDSPVSALPAYERWLLFAQDNPVENETWRNPQMNLEAHIEKYPDIPILMVTSWYGHHQWSTFRKLDAFAHHKSPTRVLVGTWIHASPYGDSAFSGQAMFGPAATVSMNQIRIRWFGATLRGENVEALAASPRITYFVMGGGSGRRDPDGKIEHGGRWTFAESWPPAGGADLALHLTAAGRLDSEAPAKPGRRTIAANLDAPVPTIGSSIQNPEIIPGFLVTGGADQVERPDAHLSPGTGLPLSSRPDVAVFRTAPLDEPLEITGPIYVKLWLSASAPSCDISVKIVDEHPKSGDWPGGFALNIAEHHQRFASWTSRLADDEAVPTEVEIGPIHLANLFGKGHRIRLQIANTNWPRYDLNPESPRRFRFSIWCGGDTPSVIRGPGALRRQGA
jgi:putative CocE/NonD family hydrolase